MHLKAWLYLAVLREVHSRREILVPHFFVLLLVSVPCTESLISIILAKARWLGQSIRRLGTLHSFFPNMILVFCL